MELPIDHFRLIGVSPSAQAEAVLRAFQLRLDRPPSQGFTEEVLMQRSELLRLSADLLTNNELREEYEKALVGGAYGLELSSNREVAGLILLWEANASYEAFELAKKALQPPQAPALGSGREADLTLVAALSCRSAAQHEEELRHYEFSALLLKEGIQLLQRMGKLPDYRKELERDFEALLPYRILDLLSRDLGEDNSHQEGLALLEAFVRERGGLEGKVEEKPLGGLEQRDFELFFQQIRKFLTVQEQLDLYLRWHKKGSSDAGFLRAISLIAAGFSQRKPEKLIEARKSLNNLNSPELDLMPLLGSIDLLLADVSKAEEKFLKSTDKSLTIWMNNYPGEKLEAICDYCRDWLRRDVLPGFRDIDSQVVDLEAWFADRDVQGFVENLDQKRGFSPSKAGFSFLASLSEESSSNTKVLGDASFETEERSISENEKNSSQISNYASEEALDNYQKFQLISNILKSFPQRLGHLQQSIKSISTLPAFPWVTISVVSAILVIGFLNNFFGFKNNRILNEDSIENDLDQTTLINENEVLPDNKEETLIDIKADDGKTLSEEEEKRENTSSSASQSIKPLTSKKPTEEQIKFLVNIWLEGKASFLSGGELKNLPLVARQSLLERVSKERMDDGKKGEIQIIQAEIKSLKLAAQTHKRIEAKVKLSYQDLRRKESGEILSQTSIPNLQVTYIFGREKGVWLLVDYISGQ